MEEIYLSFEQALKVFNVSRGTLNSWSKEGMPKLARGKYPLLQCLQWFRENKEKGSSLTDERRRLVAVQRQLKERELAIQNGEFISREEVLARSLEKINFVRDGLLSLPRTLPAKLRGKDPAEMTAIIKKAVYSLLDHFSGQKKGK